MVKAKENEQQIDRDLLVEAFKALSNRNRLAIFEHIRMCGAGAGCSGAGSTAVCNVASSVNLSLSTISHHIKELRRARLIRCERRGQSIL